MSPGVRSFLPGTLLLALLFVAAPPASGDGEALVDLDVPETIRGVLLEDLDGDGAKDILLLEDRRARLYPGRKDGLPAREAAYEVDLSADVTFVDALPPTASGPGLLLLGTRGVARLDLATGKTTPRPAIDGALEWSDWRQADLADLAKADGSILVPTPSGWRRHRPGGGVVDLPVPRIQMVEPAGGHLEKTTIVTHALPQVWLADVVGRPSMWALGDRALVATFGEHTIRYDASFLPQRGARGTVTLIDLTGDGTPEVVHADGTNRERNFAIFKTPVPTMDEGLPPVPGGSLKPPAAVLRLSGYCLEPEYVDLDGDGFLDFVLTTIPIDGRNTARALGGNVTAHTRAFLNRTGRRPGAKLFPGTPDADIVSDIGVQIRFSPAGSIDIRRSFTILVSGDYDGDVKKDLAIRTGPDTLTIRRGIERGVWEAEGREIRIPPLGESPNVEGFSADLTGDGRDEILLLYRKPWKGRDRLRVLRP